MSTTQLVAAGTYGPLTTTLGPAVVPLGADRYKILIEVGHMTNPAQSYALVAEISFDAGVTWRPFVMSGLGGNASYSPGQLSGLGGGIPDPTNTGRRIRAKLTLVGPPIQTDGVTLELSP